MITSRRFATAFLLLAPIALVCPPRAEAVIRVDFPVSKIYAASKAVLVGTVASVRAETRVAEVRVDQVVKGKGTGPLLRIQVVKPAPLFARVAADQRVVLFVGEARGKPVAVVHLADAWLVANGIPGAKTPAWRIGQRYDAARSFPGRTPALIRLIASLQAGKPGIQDETYPEAFRPKLRALGSLGVAQPSFLVHVPLGPKGEPGLAVGTPKGLRLFRVGADTCTDATAPMGLAGASAAHCAAGDADGDGDADLLLGATLWLADAGGFKKAPVALELPPEADWLAAALADATGDGRPDAVVVLRTGKAIVCANPGKPDGPWPASPTTLWQGGSAPQAALLSPDWADDGGLHALVVRPDGMASYAIGPPCAPSADFQRLTGGPLATCRSLAGKPLDLRLAVGFDCDGNGKADLLALTQAGGLALMNRGFAAFLPSGKIHAALLAAATAAGSLKLAPGTLAAPGRRRPRTSQDLFLLTPDGRLFTTAAAP